MDELIISVLGGFVGGVASYSLLAFTNRKKPVRVIEKPAQKLKVGRVYKKYTDVKHKTPVKKVKKQATEKKKPVSKKNEEEQTCVTCRKILALSNFYKNKTKKNGHSDQCKSCKKIDRVNRIRTKAGLIGDIYDSRRTSQVKLNRNPVKFTKQQLSVSLLKMNMFHSLYSLWVASDYAREFKPTLKRKNQWGEWTLENIKMVAGVAEK